VQDLFDQASALEANARAAFLNAQCVGDDVLRAEVDALLVADEQAGGFLAEPTIAPNRIDPVNLATPTTKIDQPRQIGPYKLLQLIGEGGFGAVWMAEQETPVRRRVALKIIKPGMDTQQVIARFEAERQALAMMDHPNIARVFDAGATDAGRPFFVMEVVNGVPITNYCDESRLTARERLELFIPVCQAVQHAHQKGIIHRDIKPSNVLVTLHDGRPVPKVIDFGVAKATQARLTEKTLFTELRTMVGTPEYMSPEQAEMGGLDVDTRSDVYSLGVLLYELLTGVTPLDPRELRSKAFAEMQRVIREIDPPRPSARLSTVATLASIAAQRSVEPQKLHALVRGELDWIVMKCLEKDRTRRYESASSLTGDIMRYLADEPVDAAAPSRWYRLRKFVRRNKGPVIASAAVLAALIAGIIGTTMGLIGQARQRHIAELHRAEAEHQRGEVQIKVQQLENEAAITDAVVKFQSQMLASADPSQMLGDKVTVLQTVTAAVQELDSGKLKSQPLVEAAVRETAGITLSSLGRYDAAEPNLRKALELRRQVRPEGHQDIAHSLNFVAFLLKQQGKLDEAEPLFRKALEIRINGIPSGDPLIGSSLSQLAEVQRLRGNLSEAELLLREALGIQRKRLPAGDPDLAATLNSLGLVLKSTRRFAEAETLLREALETQRKVLPPGHPEIARALGNLGVLMQAQQRLAEAEPLLLEALAIERKVLPIGHPDIARVAGNIAWLLHDQGKYAEAEPLFREALADFQRAFGNEHWFVANTEKGLGSTLVALDRHAEAETLLVEAERVWSIAQGVPAERRHQCKEALVQLYTAWDKSDPGKGYGNKAAYWKAKLSASRPATTSATTRP
jgi:serine/threonine protein kinase/Flp pilus assembly protein TadD